MKHWHKIAALILSTTVLSLVPRTAAAQSFEALTDTLANVIAKTGVIVDSVLGTWVAGNDLTDPVGEQFVAALSHIVVNFTDFFAVLVKLF